MSRAISWKKVEVVRPQPGHADIGISLPGTFEEPVAPVFVDGQLSETLRGEGIVPRFLEILDGYVDRRYGIGVRTR